MKVQTNSSRDQSFAFDRVISKFLHRKYLSMCRVLGTVLGRGDPKAYEPGLCSDSSYAHVGYTCKWGGAA